MGTITLKNLCNEESEKIKGLCYPTDTIVHTILSLKNSAEHEGGIVLYHGGLPGNIILDQIDCNRLGTKQNKKGRTYGGFYLTDESSRSWSEDYAKQKTGKMHGFLIASSARILETDRVIDRLSQEERNGYALQWDLVKGIDICERTQYVLLNKSVVRDIGVDNIL